MNSYRLTPTAPSRPRVYQFHHLGVAIILFWQEWEDSNPRPAVLETAALTRLSYTPLNRPSGTPARTRTGACGLGNRCSIRLSYRG